VKNLFSQKLNNPFGKILSALEPMQRKIILRLALLVVVPFVTIVLAFAQTLAWQTNVVHTSGVMFSADNWNFSAEVALVGENFSISPGEHGVIDMQLSNDSVDLAAASVKVSKTQIIEQMRKRIYFYIDASTTRNSETLDKIYVNNRNSHTYTIFPHNELVLGAQSKSQTLNWEWTYDNLGYYVYGKKTETGQIIVEEYLRPIVYDYDFMKTTFNDDGSLETIDGQKTAAQFITEFSLTDGYEGQISPASLSAEGYYTVSINETTGYGVFAYLCTSDEINEGAISDTQLGNSAAALGTATVQITGQNCSSDGTLVFDENGLKQALSAPGLSIVKLDKDITLGESIALSDTSQAVIDLGGHTLTSSAETAFEVQNGASLMVSNGTISANGSAAVSSKGASVTLNKVTVTNADEGIEIRDYLANNMDSTVHIKDSNIIAKEDGILLHANAEATDKKTNIVIENSSITGENYGGIVCNGARYGSDITVKNSTVKGKYTAIYFPQRESTLSIENSTLEGYTGLAVKGGTVDIVDSTIVGTGEYVPLPDDASGLSQSGWWDTGDGIYLEANYTLWDTKITVSGDKTSVTSICDGTQAVRIFPADASNAKIEIFGGTYSSDVSQYLGEGYTVEIVDGKYKVTKSQ